MSKKNPGGKGDKQRPRFVTFEDFAKNWDTAFKEKKKADKEKEQK